MTNRIVTIPVWIVWRSIWKCSDVLRNQCNLYEGSVVRVIRRLEELIRELATAAKTIGNEELASTLGNLWMIQSNRMGIGWGSNRIGWFLKIPRKLFRDFKS